LSPGYSWNIADLTLNNNHSLTQHVFTSDQLTYINNNRYSSNAILIE
jgi:hypothetical protein